MADNAVLYKLLAKSVGIKYGIMPTFMAKPWANVSSPLIEAGPQDLQAADSLT